MYSTAFHAKLRELETKAASVKMRRSEPQTAELRWNDKPLERAVVLAMLVCMLAAMAAGYMLGRL